MKVGNYRQSDLLVCLGGREVVAVDREMVCGEPETGKDVEEEEG